MTKSTKLPVRYRYLDRYKLGGTLKTCEDFVVREIIEPKFLRKFERKDSGVKKTEGRFLLVLMKKHGMTTAEAIKNIENALDINKNDIGYAGLKDKFSVSYQYLTISATEEKIKSVKLDNIELSVVGRTNKKIFPGNLVANEFEITLHGCNKKEISSIGKLGVLPNYFGFQRFSKCNHVIGKCMVKRDFEAALNLINENGCCYSDIRSVPKKMLKFFVHAYQSWLFNEALCSYVSTKKLLFNDVKIFGFNTVLGNNKFDAILKKLISREGISSKDFMFPELRFSCPGGLRPAFLKISGLDYNVISDVVKLKFTLSKGSYATNVLNALGVKK